MPKFVEPDDAYAVMVSAGVTPLGPYPGAKATWPGVCMACGAETTSSYSTVSKGHGPCNACAKAATARKQVEAGRIQAGATLDDRGFALCGEYLNAKSPVRIRCLDCGQIATRTLDAIKQGQKCECKRLPRQPLAEFRPDLGDELHPTWNGRRTAQTIGTGERANVWWLCPNGHEYESTPANRVHEKGGTSCPYCLGMKARSGESDLVTLHPNLASELAEAQPNGIDPSRLLPKSNKKVTWQCVAHPEHLWNAPPASRIAGHGCPYCSGQKVKAGFNDLATLAPGLAAEWHPTKNAERRPDQVTRSANSYAWWLCAEGHEWRAVINSRRNGVGCPRCAQKGFDSTMPGILYVVIHRDYMAGKIGITNVNARTDRLKELVQSGWEIVSTTKRDNGLLVRDVETRVLRWIRKDLGLPTYLGAAEMKMTGGHSETFSLEGVSIPLLIKTAAEILANLESEGKRSQH